MPTVLCVFGTALSLEGGLCITWDGGMLAAAYYLFLAGSGMVQTSRQYEFVHHALCLYESRLSAETVQWFSEDLTDLWSLGVVIDYPLKASGASRSGREEKPDRSQVRAWIVKDGNIFKSSSLLCIWIHLWHLNYSEGPLLMEVWLISHTAKEEFVWSVLTICHTEYVHEIYVSSDNALKSCWRNCVCVFRCFNVCKICLVNGLSVVKLSLF